MANAQHATRVLFDEPGPRGRAQIRLITVIVLILFALLIAGALWQFGTHGQLAAARWKIFSHPAIMRLLGKGMLGTLIATSVGAIFAFPLGLLLALGRLSKNRVLSAFCTGWIEFFRAIPMLLVVYAFLLALPRYGMDVATFWKLVIPMILVSSATTAEVFRAGILAVDKGQSEAAVSLGMTRATAMRLVILPQAFRIVLPGLLTQLVTLLKDSTLGFVVSYNELMQQGRVLIAAGYTKLIQTYLVVAVIYVLGNLLITKLAEYLQRRMGRTASTNLTDAEANELLTTHQ